MRLRLIRFARLITTYAQREVTARSINGFGGALTKLWIRYAAEKPMHDIWALSRCMQMLSTRTHNTDAAQAPRLIRPSTHYGKGPIGTICSTCVSDVKIQLCLLSGKSWMCRCSSHSALLALGKGDRSRG